MNRSNLAAREHAGFLQGQAEDLPSLQGEVDQHGEAGTNTVVAGRGTDDGASSQSKTIRTRSPGRRAETNSPRQHSNSAEGPAKPSPPNKALALGSR